MAHQNTKNSQSSVMDEKGRNGEEEEDQARRIRLAKEWDNRSIEIRGIVGGRITVNKETGAVWTCGTLSVPAGNTIKFIVRASTDVPGAVAFEVMSEASPGEDPPTDSFSNAMPMPQYLTVDIYGDDCRKEAAQALAAIPAILADSIPLVIDFAIGRPTGETNFEGPGFNYTPMTTRSNNSPTKLQLFSLEEEPPQNAGAYKRFGVRSLFGSYWRSQHWDNTISQSNHLERDETWLFHDLTTRNVVIS